MALDFWFVTYTLQKSVILRKIKRVVCCTECQLGERGGNK